MKWLKKYFIDPAVPWHIHFLGWSIKIIDSKDNMADGKIIKHNFISSQRNTLRFGHRVVGCQDGFDMIWDHIIDDWFKEVGKWPE